MREVQLRSSSIFDAAGEVDDLNQQVGGFHSSHRIGGDGGITTISGGWRWLGLAWHWAIRAVRPAWPCPRRGVCSTTTIAIIPSPPPCIGYTTTVYHHGGVPPWSHPCLVCCAQLCGALGRIRGLRQHLAEVDEHTYASACTVAAVQQRRANLGATLDVLQVGADNNGGGGGGGTGGGDDGDSDDGLSRGRWGQVGRVCGVPQGWGQCLFGALVRWHGVVCLGGACACG